MADPFTKQSEAPLPPWSLVSYPAVAFTPLSSTGQEQIPGGFGLGGFGNGPFGTGEATSISISTVVQTTWTAYVTK